MYLGVLRFPPRKPSPLLGVTRKCAWKVSKSGLAPDIVAAILDDALPNHITLFDLAVDPPALWDEQRERVGL